ncbi:MAG: hypothetical protein D6731_21165 [Planctomycetota bacterium]|nr:MAG: hypothetical protein D6731_21165 [Planctomycetota bacterium]
MWDWLAFGAAPRPGDRAPDVVYGDGDRLHDTLRGPWHTLLLFDGAAPTAEGYRNLRAIANQVFRRYGERIRSHIVVPRGARPRELADYDDSVLLDPGGRLHERSGAGSECLYLIRPDGHVGCRSQPATFDPLLGCPPRILRG